MAEGKGLEPLQTESKSVELTNYSNPQYLLGAFRSKKRIRTVNDKLRVCCLTFKLFQKEVELLQAPYGAPGATRTRDPQIKSLLL